MSQKPSPPMSSLPFRSRQYKDAAANALAYVEDTGTGHREAPFTSSPPVRGVGGGGKQDDGCAYDFANLLQIENDVRVDNPENLHGNQPVRRMCAVEVGVNDIRPSSPTMMLAGMRSIEEWQSVDTSTNTAGESHSHNQSRCVPTPPLPTSSPSPRSSILLPQGSDSHQAQQQQQQMPPPMNDEAGELQMPRYQRGVVVVSTAAITATPPPQSMSTLFASERSLSFRPMDRVDHNNNNMDEEQDEEEEEDLTLSATHEDSMTDMLPPLPVSPRVGGQRHQISISSNNSAILTLERSSDDDEDLPQACTLLLEDDPEDVPPVEGESHTSFSLGMDESRRSSIATSREAAITNAANNTTASLSSQKRPSEAEGGRGMSSSYGCTDHDSHTMTPSPTPDMYTRTGVEHTAEGKQSAAPHEDEEDVDSPQPTAPQRRLDFSDTEEDSHDDTTTDIRNAPAATAIGCSSNNRSSFLDDTGSLTDEALCVYTEAVRAYEGTFAAYHANLAVLTTRIAFMTTSMYPTFVTVRGADFLKEEDMEGLLISAPPPPSMPPPPSSPSSPPCGSPRNRSLQSLPLLPPPQGTRSPRLLVSPEVCGLAATCPASFQQALASQQQQQHTLTLDRLFEYYAHHGGVTDEQMSGILDAMFDSVVEMHRSLLTHVWFNVSYAVTVACPALCTLEQHTRRMLCMRRDLFVRDTIELFMMMLPNNKRNHNNVSARRAASSARRPSGSSSSNSNRSSSNGGILQSMKGVLAAFKRRTSTPSPRRGRGGGEDASAASSGIPQYARRSVSAMTAVRRSSATTTPLPPPSVPPAGTVHLPDIELRRKNGPVLRSRESRPTVFRKRTPPRTPTAEDFTDLTACPLR